NGWTPSGGSWAVRSTGSHVLTQSDVAANAVSLAGSSWSAQSIQATVTPTLFEGSGEYVAVLARVQDASNYYALVLRDANKAEIRRVSGGTSKVLASVSFTVDTGVPYTVRLSAQGSSLTGYVNGQSVVSAGDSTFGSGRIGLGTFDGTADFDNVVVTSS
ncbi:pectate lyase, partial [Streptomyces bryophytorum]